MLANRNLIGYKNSPEVYEKEVSNQETKMLRMFLLDVFDHVGEGQRERNQKMGYTNSQRIDECVQIHIHVRQAVKREQVSVA